MCRSLEVFAGELASVVHHNVARSAVVCHVLPHVFYDVLCVFCFKGEKPNKSTVMIHYCEYIAVSLYTSCHISEIYSYSFQGFINWGQLLPLLLQATTSSEPLTSNTFFYICTYVNFKVCPIVEFLCLFMVFFWPKWSDNSWAC